METSNLVKIRDPETRGVTVYIYLYLQSSPVTYLMYYWAPASNREPGYTDQLWVVVRSILISLHIIMILGRKRKTTTEQQQQHDHFARVGCLVYLNPRCVGGGSGLQLKVGIGHAFALDGWVGCGFMYSESTL